MRTPSLIPVFLCAFGAVAVARPPIQLSLPASHDNTMFNYGDIPAPGAVGTPNSGDLSNGAGDGIFAGRTLTNGVRRGLIMFDLSSIPAGSTITTATLSLVCIRAGSTFTVREDLHRLIASWGEAGSISDGGGGGAAQAGDATWLYRFYTSSSWTTPGGDFSATVSATAQVGLPDTYTWSGPGLLADVQGWVNVPATNFGWIVVGEEVPVFVTEAIGAAPISTVKMFGSRENTLPQARPVLSVTYTPPCPGDINQDGVVNTFDLGTLLSHFGQSVPVGTLGDVNNDGTVNTFDLGILLSHFGASC